jgi:hypothetical protein
MADTTTINPFLMQAIYPILSDRESSRAVNVDLTFKNTANAEVMVVVGRDIRGFVFTQNFIENISDKLRVSVNIKLTTFNFLMHWRKDLRCELRMGHVNARSGALSVEPTFFSKQYRCIILTQRDPFKMYPAKMVDPGPNASALNQPFTEQRIDVELELIPEDVYELRKLRIHATYHKVKMEQILYHTASLFNIKKCSIVTPDNTKEYENFIIPPMMGFRELYGWLQRAPGNGIYNYGFCYYYTDETLFIFPRFAAPANKNVTHIYAVGKENFGVVDNCSTRDENGNLHILANSMIDTMDYTDLGIENEATAIMFQEATTLIANSHKMLSTGGFKVNPDNFDTLHWRSPKGIASDVFTPEYKISRGNQFVHSSSLKAMEGYDIELYWKNAELGSILPNRLIKFHYEVTGADGMHLYTAADCSCDSIEYAFSPEDSRFLPVFGCIAKMKLYSRDLPTSVPNIG